MDGRSYAFYSETGSPVSQWEVTSSGDGMLTTSDWLRSAPMRLARIENNIERSQTWNEEKMRNTRDQDGNPRTGSLKPPLPGGYVEEHWVWDGYDLSSDTALSPCGRDVYFHTDPVLESCGTAGVRGTTGFAQGEHYWEVEFVEPPSGFSVMVGVGTAKATLHAGSFEYINLLGKDAESWGLSYKGTVWHRGSSRQYTDPFYDGGTVIGVHLNLEQGTLTFYKNTHSLGLAFTGLHKVQSPLYPMVSSTAPGTELTLGCRCSTLPTLEERCLHTLAHGLAQKDMLDLLPLPVAVRWKLKS